MISENLPSSKKTKHGNIETRMDLRDLSTLNSFHPRLPLHEDVWDPPPGSPPPNACVVTHRVLVLGRSRGPAFWLGLTSSHLRKSGFRWVVWFGGWNLEVFGLEFFVGYL